MSATTDLPKRPSDASKATLDSAVNQTVNGEAAAATTASDDAAASGAASNTDANANEYRTVFQDANNFNVKHPLYNSWTLWFDNPSQKGMASARGTKDSWGDDMNKVVDFDSVEEFWGLYNNVVPPSELPQKANYYLFKQGVKPAWEDPANTNGGKWSILPREKSRAQIDRLWLYTMLAAIGETLEAPFPNGVPPPSSSAEDELVTGVIMSARANFYRIAIWTRKAEDTDELAAKLLDIGKQFKVNVLGYDIDAKIGAGLTSDVEFQSHKESEKKKGKKTVV